MVSRRLDILVRIFIFHLTRVRLVCAKIRHLLAPFWTTADFMAFAYRVSLRWTIQHELGCEMGPMVNTVISSAP